jgi:hypothetical protein
MITALVRMLVTRRLGWIVLSLPILAISAVMVVGSHRIQPVQIDGTISSYKEFTNSGTYERNELQIAGDSRTFTLDKHQFHPTLPDEVFRDGSVSVWVDQGNTQVLAIMLYDENDQNPTKYTTDTYNDPDTALRNSYVTGGVVGAVGLLVLAVGLAWPLFPWGRKKTAQSVPTHAGPGGNWPGGQQL